MGCPLRSIGLLEDYSCPQALGNFVTAPPTAERQQQDVGGIGGLFTKCSEIQCSQALSNFATASARLDTNNMMSVASVAAAASAAPGGGAYPSRPRSPPPRLGSPGLVQVPLFAPAPNTVACKYVQSLAAAPRQPRPRAAALRALQSAVYQRNVRTPYNRYRPSPPRPGSLVLVFVLPRSSFVIELVQLCLRCTHFVCHSQVAGCGDASLRVSASHVAGRACAHHSGSACQALQNRSHLR